MGNHQRDFTYIDDIVDGIIKASFKKGKPDSEYTILEMEKKVSLMKYINYRKKTWFKGEN